jgi:hypothetical protein
MARSKHAEPRVLVAAARRIPLDDSTATKKQAGKRQDWQEDSWAYFDLVPEIKYSTWFLGNAMSKLRLFVATEDPEEPDGEPIPVDDERSTISQAVASQAIAELRRLSGGGGGGSSLGEILREANMNLEIAAEGWLIGRGQRIDEETGRETAPESWEIHSTSEVEAKKVKLPDGREASMVVKENPEDRSGTPLDPDLDTAIRFWQRHPRWGNLPDCAMRGVLDECETLLVLSRQARAEARSRLPAGILVTPAEFDYSTTDQTATDDNEEALGDPFLNALVIALTDPIQDESSPAGLAPLLARVPSAPGDNLRDRFFHIDLARKTDEALDARIKTRIDRIARGINLPVEVVMGHQQTTFANAEQVDQDTYEDHLEPRAILLCDIFTGEFLRQQLREAFSTADGIVPDEVEDEIRSVFVWMDPSRLVASPNVEENAELAYDRFELSGSAYRRYKGYDETDAPTPIEMLIRAGLRRGIFTADLTKALIELLGEEIEVVDSAQADETIESSETAPSEDPDAGDGETAARLRTLARLLVSSQQSNGNGQAPPAIVAAPQQQVPEDNPGRRLVDLDRDLRARLLVLADRTMTRALERAGNIIKSKAKDARPLVRNVAADRVGVTLGRSIVANAGINPEELLEGAFDSMEAQFLAWAEHAQEEALAYASEIAGGFTVAEREALALRQAEDVAEAWAWARETLEAQAAARLFDPEAFVGEVGEVDPNMRVQAGIIRQAMARAGGTRGVQTGSAGEAWISIADGGQRPAGGIGTGELIREALTSHGVEVEAYRWIYGIAARRSPFEPHRALDGVVFENFDDEVLANRSSFPPLSHYLPGDHAGCLCDFEPVIVPRSELS